MNKARAIAEKWKAGATEVSAENYIEPTLEPQQSSEGQDKPNSSHSGVASTSEADTDLQKLMGQELGSIFKDHSIHPVFIFGSKGSGKTSLLASLLKYAQMPTSGLTIDLADKIFPQEDGQWYKHVAWVRDLYYKKIFSWMRGEAPRSTLEESPFFIPVTVGLSSGANQSFAFLEGKGEWYMGDVNAEIPFRPFHSFIKGVLEQYNGAATIIFIAPFVTGGYGSQESTNSVELNSSDIGLVGALNEYVSLRRAVMHHDKQLFLLTKWDVRCGGISSDAFANPDYLELEEIFNERFPLSWAKFQGISASSVESNKAFSPYCSGVIEERTVLKPARDDAAEVDRYARKLWDWIYKNATGRHLYFDMQPKKKNILDKLISSIRGA